MKNIVGKIFLYCIIFFARVIHCQNTDNTISLWATTIDNQPFVNAAIGEPFLLHVQRDNATMNHGYPQVAVPQYVTTVPQGFEMKMSNNRTSTVYHYQVMIDKPGSYVLGPAKFDLGASCIESQTIRVTASKSNANTTPGLNQKGPHTFLRLTIEKDRAFLNEEIPCTLSLYSNDPHFIFNSILEPRITDNFEIRNQRGPLNKTETKDSIRYQCAEWKWNLYPKKTGTFTIPAYAVEYIENQKRGLMAFLSIPHTKKLYSNAQTITIAPLPEHDQEVCLVGKISQFNMKLEPDVISLQQGSTLIIEICGTGNLEGMSYILLQNLPEAIKEYESKKIVNDNHNEKMCRMEYILQANKEGIYQIPSQHLCYFDLQTHDYQTISTNSALLQVTPAGKLTNSSPRKIITEHKDQIMPIHRMQSFDAFWIASPAWHVYWYLIMTIIFGWLFFFIIGKNIYIWYGRKNRHLKKLNHTFELIKKNKQYDALYPFFIELCAFYFNTSTHMLNKETLLVHLEKNGFSSSMMIQWCDFFSILEQLRFGLEELPFDEKELIKKSEYWIDTIISLRKQTSIPYTIFLFLLLSSLSTQCAKQDLFAKACSAYDAKNYEQALQLFGQINQKTAAIWFNMGNCAYQNHDDLNAFIYWQKAIKYGYGALAKDAANNCKMIATPWNNVNKNSFFYDWNLLVIIIQLLLLISLLIFLWSARRLFQKKRKFLSLFGCWVIALAVSAYYFCMDSHTKYGIVTSNTVAVFNGPTNEFHQLGQIEKGTKVTILAQHNEWTKIKTKYMVGWSNTQGITYI